MFRPPALWSGLGSALAALGHYHYQVIHGGYFSPGWLHGPSASHLKQEGGVPEDKMEPQTELQGLK